ncbi:MAG: hypothetical protein KF805_15345 [Phycisphaeraceae bacterium]|nr:hypothetical protein [Phycisphaeraceae bacterium]
MRNASWIAPVLAALAVFHLLGMIWCIRGGLDAANSDRIAFEAVAQPLQSSGAITAAGKDVLEQNVANRSVIHARVMFSYAVVHGVTALGFIAAFVIVRRRTNNSPSVS